MNTIPAQLPLRDLFQVPLCIQWMPAQFASASGTCRVKRRSMGMFPVLMAAAKKLLGICHQRKGGALGEPKFMSNGGHQTGSRRCPNFWSCSAARDDRCQANVNPNLPVDLL